MKKVNRKLKKKTVSLAEDGLFLFILAIATVL